MAPKTLIRKTNMPPRRFLLLCVAAQLLFIPPVALCDDSAVNLFPLNEVRRFHLPAEGIEVDDVDLSERIAVGRRRHDKLVAGVVIQLKDEKTLNDQWATFGANVKRCFLVSKLRRIVYFDAADMTWNVCNYSGDDIASFKPVDLPFSMVSLTHPASLTLAVYYPSSSGSASGSISLIDLKGKTAKFLSNGGGAVFSGEDAICFAVWNGTATLPCGPSSVRSLDVSRSQFNDSASEIGRVPFPFIPSSVDEQGKRIFGTTFLDEDGKERRSIGMMAMTSGVFSLLQIDDEQQSGRDVFVPEFVGKSGNTSLIIARSTATRSSTLEPQLEWANLHTISGDSGLSERFVVAAVPLPSTSGSGPSLSADKEILWWRNPGDDGDTPGQLFCVRCEKLLEYWTVQHP